MLRMPMKKKKVLDSRCVGQNMLKIKCNFSHIISYNDVESSQLSMLLAKALWRYQRSSYALNPDPFSCNSFSYSSLTQDLVPSTL